MDNDTRKTGQQGGPARRGQQHQTDDKRRREQQERNESGHPDQVRNRDPQPGDPENNDSGDQRQG